MTEEEFKEKLYDFYLDNLDDPGNFYAANADRGGIYAVYLAGVEAGKKGKSWVS